MKLFEMCMLAMAQNNTPIDPGSEQIVDDALSRSSRTALGRIANYPGTPVGDRAISLRAQANWRTAFARARMTPLARLREDWNTNTSAGFAMLRARYNNDFAAFARDYFAE